MSELLPCPFCGGEANHIRAGGGGWSSVECDCGVMMLCAPDPDPRQMGALRKWNRRAPQDSRGEGPEADGWIRKRDADHMAHEYGAIVEVFEDRDDIHDEHPIEVYFGTRPPEGKEVDRG